MASEDARFPGRQASSPLDLLLGTDQRTDGVDAEVDEVLRSFLADRWDAAPAKNGNTSASGNGKVIEALSVCNMALYRSAGAATLSPETLAAISSKNMFSLPPAPWCAITKRSGLHLITDSRAVKRSTACYWFDPLLWTS